MQRVHRDAESRVRNGAHQTRRVVHARERHPRDELDVHRQPGSLRRIAQHGEAIGEARFIRIVSGGEHVARAELRRGFEERGKRRQVGRRNEASAARVEDLDAGVAQAGERFATKRRILEQRRGIAPRLAIEEPHPDEVESGSRRRANHRGRRKLRNSVVREGKGCRGGLHARDGAARRRSRRALSASTGSTGP